MVKVSTADAFSWQAVKLVCFSVIHNWLKSQLIEGIKRMITSWPMQENVISGKGAYKSSYVQTLAVCVQNRGKVKL